MEKNKLQFLILKGCSASGKSTFCADFLKENPQFVEVNRDNIRFQLYGKEMMWRGNEQEVSKIEEALIRGTFSQGKNVVSSNTNLNDKYPNRFRKLADEYNAEIVVNDSFMSVPLDELLRRDSKREFSVGSEVIKKQYNKYVMKNEFYREPYLKPQDENLPVAAIFDVDGTLTLGPESRSPYDMAKIKQDKPNPYVISALSMYLDTGARVFIFSGREVKSYVDTVDWLTEQLPFLPKVMASGQLTLHMRSNNLPGVPAESDDVVKDRLFSEHVEGQFHVVAVFDDRLRVCKNVWFKRGLPLFRVGDPTADF